jgi:hypothetical protein
MRLQRKGAKDAKDAEDELPIPRLIAVRTARREIEATPLAA